MKTMTLPSGISRILPMIAVSIGLGTAATVAAPQKVVNVNLAGKSFGVVLDLFQQPQSKNLKASSSPKKIILSNSYKYKLSGNIHGTGDLADVVNPGTSLRDFLESLDPGSSSLLSGTVNSTNGILIKKKTISGSKSLGFFSVDVSLDVEAKISATGVVGLNITNIKVAAPPFSFEGTIVFDGPTATTPGSKLTVTSL